MTMQMEEEEKKCVYVHCATYNGPSAADLYVQRAMKTRVSNFTLAKEGDGTVKEGTYLLSFFVISISFALNGEPCQPTTTKTPTTVDMPTEMPG